MALCTECGTALPGSATACPACGARRHLAGWDADAAALSVGSYPTLGSEMTFAEVRLVAAPIAGEGSPDRPGGPGAVDAPTRTPRPTVRSWVGHNDLALCALVLGVVSVVFGVLGQGWFGIVAVACGHQARRQMAGHGAVRAGSVLAITGLVLGSAAIVMMLVSLVGKPPWN